MDRDGWVVFNPYWLDHKPPLCGVFFFTTSIPLFRPERSEAAPGSVALATMVVKHEVLGVS